MSRWITALVSRLVEPEWPYPLPASHLALIDSMPLSDRPSTITVGGKTYLMRIRRAVPEEMYGE